MYQAARFAAPYAIDYAMRNMFDPATRNGRKRARRFGPFKEPYEVGGGGQQLSTSNIRYGKRVRKRELLMRILSAKLNNVTHRFQNISNSADGRGCFPLSYFNQGAGFFSSLPVVAFDLTGAQQQVINGVQTFATVCTRLQRSAAGTYNWSFIPGVDSDDAGNAYGWTTERNSGLTNTKEYASALIENVSIKLLLYGARKFPSKVMVQLVSFAEGYTPVVGSGTSVSALPTVAEASGVENAEDYNAMWMAHTAPLIGNPINTRPSSLRKLMRVHYSKTYDFQPKLSTELDVTGDQVAVYFNYKMNKRVDYARAQSVQSVTNAEEINPNEWVIHNDNELNIVALPEQRVFLLISGMTPLNGFNVVNADQDLCPSFDYCIRRRISGIDV